MHAPILLTLALLAAGGGTPAPTSAPAPLTLNIWPGEPPGGPVELSAETRTNNEQYQNVSTPTITIYRPAPDKNTGAAVLVCPGGGFTSVWANKEGEQPCAWLVENGVTAVLLKYRVPPRQGMQRQEAAVQDAQRAMNIVRSKAAEWGIDPKRIGMMGFSAGGRMLADTATNYDKLTYEPVDDADKAGSRPDFGISVYPGGLVTRGANELTAETVRVTRETPPMFIAIAHNDSNGSENALFFYLALKRAGVPAELHIYGEGGHGFGMVPGAAPHNAWPQHLLAWLQFNGWLKPAAPASAAAP